MIAITTFAACRGLCEYKGCNQESCFFHVAQLKNEAFPASWEEPSPECLASADKARKHQIKSEFARLIETDFAEWNLQPKCWVYVTGR